MSEYTQESPFEFEGVKLWRGEGSNGEANCVYESILDVGAIIHTPDYGEQFHAFIEAERNADTWHWTNDDHTEARKGRWSAARAVEVGDPDWAIRHDDFPDCWAHDKTRVVVGSWMDRAHAELDDFLAWRAEQNQPEEPTGLGAVVEVRGKRYVRSPESGDKIPWCNSSSGYWGDWSEITERGPVTILSPGVTP